MINMFLVINAESRGPLLPFPTAHDAAVLPVKAVARASRSILVEWNNSVMTKRPREPDIFVRELLKF